jgi:hypothetical protein
MVHKFSSLPGPFLAFYGCLNQNSYHTIMKSCIQALIITAGALALAGTVRAGESVAGTWRGQFDSQIGQQKYTFVFKMDGTNVTGTATGEREMGTNTVVITEAKISNDQISFVEPLKFQDNELRIEYTGKVNGDEIKFHRKVGDVAEEDFVAHRIRQASMTSGMKPEPSVETNSPPAKP